MKDVFSNADPICYIFTYNMTFVSDIFSFSKPTGSNRSAV